MSTATESSQNPLHARYLACLDRLLGLVESVSLNHVPKVSRNLPYFSGLADSEKERLIDLTELLADSTEELLRNQESALDGMKLAQTFLARAALHTASDAFRSYRDGDFVEIYLSNGQSIFSSLNIIALSSYTLEELQCRPWTDLWHREDSVTQQLMALIGGILTDHERKTVYMPTPVHQIFERASSANRSLWIHNKTFSPVWTTDGGTVGFICINEARSKIAAPPNLG